MAVLGAKVSSTRRRFLEFRASTKNSIVETGPVVYSVGNIDRPASFSSNSARVGGWVDGRMKSKREGGEWGMVTGGTEVHQSMIGVVYRLHVCAQCVRELYVYLECAA